MILLRTEGIISLNTFNIRTPSIPSKNRISKLNCKNENVTNCNMVSQFSKIALFSTLLVLCVVTYTDAKVGTDCLTDGKPDDWKCDDGEYCHYKRKTCQKSKSTCVLSAQQITCMLLTGPDSIVGASQTLACEVVTKNEEKQKLCKGIYEQVEAATQTACDVALSQICCPENCPENYGAEPCKKFGRNYHC